MEVLLTDIEEPKVLMDEIWVIAGWHYRRHEGPIAF